MKPLYISDEFSRNYDTKVIFDKLMALPWIQVTEARLECFMALQPTEYTYGSGKGVRTYTSIPFDRFTVLQFMMNLNGPIHKDCGGRAEPADQTLICGRCGAQDWNEDEPWYKENFFNELISTNINYNVCFLNRYDNEKQALGWHSDDSPGMLHDHPIAVVSFGEPREIWVKPIDHKGHIPSEWRFSLADGSLFVMPPGFQMAWQHKIPKGDRPMKTRVSLTFRRYEP